MRWFETGFEDHLRLDLSGLDAGRDGQAWSRRLSGVAFGRESHWRCFLQGRIGRYDWWVLDGGFGLSMKIARQPLGLSGEILKSAVVLRRQAPQRVAGLLIQALNEPGGAAGPFIGR
ncbi:MAG: hypothetical protein M3R45_13555 [Pseudomonadota bacterium]|nr:hypothetical protein [Pseudomonadota bacterium]